MKCEKQSFLKGSAILLGMIIITKTMGIIYKIFLTRLLGGIGMGYYSYVYSVFTPVLAAVCSGIPTSVARLCAQNYALERYANLSRIKTTAKIIFGLVSFLAFGVLTCISFFMEKKISFSLLCISPAVIFCTYISVERGFREGLGNMIPTAVSEIIETVFRIILSLGFADAVRKYAIDCYTRTGMCFNTPCSSMDECINASLPYIVSAAVAGSAAASLIACIYLFVSGRLAPDVRKKITCPAQKVKDGYGETAKNLYKITCVCSAAAVISTVEPMIDMLTIKPVISFYAAARPEDFALFFNSGISSASIGDFMYGSYTALALTVYGLIPTLTAMLGKGLLPSFCSDYATGSMKNAAENLKGMLWLSGALAVPSGLGICVFSKEILQLIFSSRTLEISAAHLPLTILGIGVIFTGIYLPCLTILQSVCKGRKVITIMLISCMIKLVLNVLLMFMADFGLCGAAAATVISDFFVCVMSLRETLQLINVKISLVKLFAKQFYAGIICIAGAVLSYRYLHIQQIITLDTRIYLLISIAIGGILYVFSLYLLCEMPKNMLNRILGKKIQKST